MLRLWIEFTVLYLGLPALLLACRLHGLRFPVLPLLWLATLPAACCLVQRYGWDARRLLGPRLTRRQTGGLLARAGLAAALLAGGVLLLAPDRFLELPRRDFTLWCLVMGFYPLLSVLPQSVLYRALFYERYARLFRTGVGADFAGALVFSLAHLVFANGWALALTLVGGWLINRTYRQTGSLPAAALEHAAYGQLAFTTGWGRFLYHGTARLLEQGLG